MGFFYLTPPFVLSEFDLFLLINLLNCKHRTGFCGSGAGRKASVICISLFSFSWLTEYYLAFVLNFGSSNSIGLYVAGGDEYKFPHRRKALFVTCKPFRHSIKTSTYNKT